MEKEILPNHIAVIPDGNRRWAYSRGLPSHSGHKEGLKRFTEVSQAAFRTGIAYFTFWAASEDNLRKRSGAEIAFLTSLLEHELERQLLEENFVKNEVKFRLLGRWREILPDIANLDKVVRKLEEQTSRCGKTRLTVLFGYDGKREMLEAINKSKIKNQKSKITEDDIQDSLLTNFLPPVDLVIRTGGEPHWSAGFMMWHTADSQFYFTHIHWPDFTKEEFERSLAEYAARERRFGK